MIIDEFSKYQIEWLTSHCDIEFNKEEEDLIIRFLKDTAEMYQRENECEDCISRQAAIDIIEGHKFVYVEDIEELPSVTPELIKGKWLEVIDDTDSSGRKKNWHYKCSICGNEDSGWGEFNYCPICGAEMKGV